MKISKKADEFGDYYVKIDKLEPTFIDLDERIREREEV